MVLLSTVVLLKTASPCSRGSKGGTQTEPAASTRAQDELDRRTCSGERISGPKRFIREESLPTGGRTALMAKPKTIEVVYEDGVFKPLEPVDVTEGTRVPLNLAKVEVLKTYRGRFGKLDETVLREFELEASTHQ